MIAWFARNGVATNFLMGMILIGGFFSMRNLKMQLFPEFELQEIAILAKADTARSKKKLIENILAFRQSILVKLDRFPDNYRG